MMTLSDIASTFDDVYTAIIKDVTERLIKAFPRYKIELDDKKHCLEDIVYLHINNMEFKLDIPKYIEDSSNFGESETFKKLKEEIIAFVSSPHT